MRAEEKHHQEWEFTPDLHELNSSMFGSQVRQQGRPEGQSDASPSDGAQKKAQAAKSYIENMYKVQYQNIQQRADRQGI